MATQLGRCLCCPARLVHRVRRKSFNRRHLFIPAGMVTMGKAPAASASGRARGGTRPPLPPSAPGRRAGHERGTLSPPLPTVRGYYHGRRAQEVTTRARAPGGLGCGEVGGRPGGPQPGPRGQGVGGSEPGPRGPAAKRGGAGRAPGRSPDGGAAPSRSGAKTSRPAGRRSDAGPGMRSGEARAARRGGDPRRRRRALTERSADEPPSATRDCDECRRRD